MACLKRRVYDNLRDPKFRPPVNVHDYPRHGGFQVLVLVLAGVSPEGEAKGGVASADISGSYWGEGVVGVFPGAQGNVHWGKPPNLINVIVVLKQRWIGY